MLAAIQQHSGAAMQSNRHLKVGSLTEAQAAQRRAEERARGQKRPVTMPVGWAPAHWEASQAAQPTSQSQLPLMTYQRCAHRLDHAAAHAHARHPATTNKNSTPLCAGAPQQEPGVQGLQAQATGVGHHTAAVGQASNHGAAQAAQTTAQEAAGSAFT